tara:strand:+ start:86 stop:310 length:225 start_codon:yes stop_codon:yes gene_type:complete
MPEQEQETPKVITLDNKKYQFDSLADDVKNDIRGLQICETQLRMTQDTLKLLTISRQSISTQLKEKLKDVEPLE